MRNLLTQLKRIPLAGDIFHFVVPFHGVPTSIVKRMYEFSPFGLATSFCDLAGRYVTGKNFDQRGFVEGVSRGLTGTAMFAIGMALMSQGLMGLGTQEEDDKRIYAAESALGKQYSPYVRIGNEYVSLSTLNPAVSALIMGAQAYEIFKEEESKLNALFNACTASLDSFFDASYMSSVQNIFKGLSTGTGSFSENLLETMASSAVSQNVPAVLAHIATALDPYVRDTKDKDALMGALKSGLISKIPLIREQVLSAKVDIAGRPVESKAGIRNFIDPMTTTTAHDDEQIEELIALARSTQDSSVLPELLIAGNASELKVSKAQAEDFHVNLIRGEDGKREYAAFSIELTSAQKETLNREYGTEVFDRLRKLMDSPRWKHADEQERADMASKEIRKARNDMIKREVIKRKKAGELK